MSKWIPTVEGLPETPETREYWDRSELVEVLDGGLDVWKARLLDNRAGIKQWYVKKEDGWEKTKNVLAWRPLSDAEQEAEGGN